MTDMSALWAALPIPALILDAHDRVAEINGSAEAFLNMSARALRGMPVWDHLHVAADLDSALVRVRDHAAQLFINNAEVSSSANAPVPCNLQLAPFGDDRSVLILLEPRQLADRMGRADAIKSAAKSAIGMAEMLAHEIKNPLAGITGAAQLLSMNLDPEDQELTDLIVAESRRIVALLTQVEQFGNLAPPTRRVVNIHDLLDRARKSAEVGFAASMTIREDYDPSLPPTYVDPDQILQVLLNLLKNAAEAAGADGGKITLRTYYDLGLRVRRADGTGDPLPLQVEIIDDGPGLPADLGATVFEPFVSGRENGTGLGLALVSKIITDHGGWIDVDSVPGRTVFRISLPLSHEKEVS